MSPTILVTAGTSQLGSLVVSNLLKRNVPASSIAVTARSGDSDATRALKDQGIEVRVADYHNAASCDEAMKGIEKVLLISSNDFNDRVGQHTNVVKAAEKAGTVQLFAYTSLANADTTKMIMAASHVGTEAYLKSSGVPYVMLRNNWYTENHSNQYSTWLKYGKITGAPGGAIINGASRDNYAEAAAVVLAGDAKEYQGKIFELGGQPGYTLDDMAKVASDVSGQTITVNNVDQSTFTQILVGAGLPEAVASVLADADARSANGDLETKGNDLERLIGHKTETFEETLRGQK